MAFNHSKSNSNSNSNNPRSPSLAALEGGIVDPHAKRDLQRLLAQWKLTPATFAYKLSRGSWIPAPHLMYISSRIAKGIAKGNARIIISAPPRHGKSELASVNVPTWIMERFPKKKIILTGYGAELATGFSRRVRDNFTDPANFELLSTRIRADASRVEAFQTTEGGAMFAVGLGGAITGRGAHVLLIDDYIKEIKEALSPTYREYVWNWFTTTAFTRLEPGGSCIIIATRWHSDDLIGRILKHLASENWEYIEIPAVARDGDLLGREVGEALFPERYPIERLRELQATLGSIYFQALYQQRPVDETSKVTDGTWLKVIDNFPMDEWGNLEFGRVWDLAGTEGGGDYACGTKVAYSKISGNFYIVNVSRRQFSPGKLEKHVQAVATADGLDCPVRIEREPGSSGKAVIEHYQTNVLPAFQVSEMPATAAKVVRAQPFLAAAEAGQVFLIKGDWNDAFIREFDAFPSSKHDDQIDTASGGFTWLTGKKIFSASWGRNSAGKSYQQKLAARAQQDSMTLNEDRRNNGPKLLFSGRRRGTTFGRT